MKKLKGYKDWGIYQNIPKEIEEYGFEYSVIHPRIMKYYSEHCVLIPSDTSKSCHTLEQAESWIDDYIYYYQLNKPSRSGTPTERMMQ